jgi:quercetin dioxygenase-like cupin family protein
VSTALGSLYVDVAARPWTERRPGVFWKVLWEDGEHKALLVRYAPGATIPRHRHLGDE